MAKFDGLDAVLMSKGIDDASVARLAMDEVWWNPTTKEEEPRQRLSSSLPSATVLASSSTSTSLRSPTELACPASTSSPSPTVLACSPLSTSLSSPTELASDARSTMSTSLPRSSELAGSSMSTSSTSPSVLAGASNGVSLPSPTVPAGSSPSTSCQSYANRTTGAFSCPLASHSGKGVATTSSSSTRQRSSTRTGNQGRRKPPVAAVASPEPWMPRRRLTALAAEMLQRIPEDQFVLPRGFSLDDVRRFPGHLDLFSGCRIAAQELANRTGDGF